jgi:hypothetical protein
MSNNPSSGDPTLTNCLPRDALANATTPRANSAMSCRAVDEKAAP